MGFGFENALAEITLVVFTALAPSGAAAFAVMGATLFSRKLDPACREWTNRFLVIPILVALIGLVASGTHLGTPENALYVLSGIGRSPLSNEVFVAGVFFGLAGSYWFYSFTRVRREMLERVWVAASIVAAVVFVLAIAYAYNVDTIVTWSHPVTPANLVLNAFVGGPLLALVGFAAVNKATKGQFKCPGARVVYVCVLISGVALILNVLGYAVQGVHVMSLSNATTTAAELMPVYPFAVGAMAVLCGVGVVLDAVSARLLCCPSLSVSIVASACALAGIFIMRFSFYMLHMTVGISF